MRARSCCNFFQLYNSIGIDSHRHNQNLESGIWNLESGIGMIQMGSGIWDLSLEINKALESEVK